MKNGVMLKRWIVSMILVCAIVCLYATAPAGGGFSMNLAAAEEIFSAGYPEGVPMPNQADYARSEYDVDYEAYYDAYSKWVEYADGNRLADGTIDGLKKYIDASAKKILASEKAENKVYSPVNVYIALSMLAEITDGNSREQILSALGAESHENLRMLAQEIFMSVYKDDGETQSIPAASVWLRNDMAYKPDALEILKTHYFASSFAGEMGSKEYDKMLADWLDRATKGLLKEQAQNMTMDRDTVIALATSLYLKAGWKDEFNKDKTALSVFHAPEGDMQAEFMNQSGSDTYYWGENFGAVALSMTGGGRMWILLPDEGVTPEALIESGAVTDFLINPEPDHQKRLVIHKSIPKFDVTGENDLTHTLKAMGVTDVFDANKSDFTCLTDLPGIVVSKAEHDARVRIDENGVEGAAYTVIMMMATSARLPEDEMNFVADRPFVFVITNQDSLPLFMGVVNTVK